MIVDRLYPAAGLHGRVAHEIGRQIVSGAIAEGELLPHEEELAETHDVSRQAVREALKVLAAKGLIAARRRIGTVVAPRRNWNLLDPDVLAWHGPAGVTPDFLSDLIELRFLIEPSAAELAAHRATSQQCARIGAALDKMKRGRHDLRLFDAGDVAFHVAVFAASGNSLIDRMSTIIAPLLQASFGLQNSVTTSVDDAIDNHEAIYRAIADGDAEAARDAMERVLSVSMDEIAELKRQSEARVTINDDVRSQIVYYP